MVSTSDRAPASPQDEVAGEGNVTLAAGGALELEALYRHTGV